LHFKSAVGRRASHRFAFVCGITANGTNKYPEESVAEHLIFSASFSWASHYFAKRHESFLSGHLEETNANFRFVLNA